MAPRLLLHAAVCTVLAACGGATHAPSDPVTVELTPAPEPAASPPPSASAVAQKTPDAPKPAGKEQEQLEMVMLGALGNGGVTGNVAAALERSPVARPASLPRSKVGVGAGQRLSTRSVWCPNPRRRGEAPTMTRSAGQGEG